MFSCLHFTVLDYKKQLFKPSLYVIINVIYTIGYGGVFKVKMENGLWADVVDCNWADTGSEFRIHRWGDIWLCASLPDNTIIVNDKIGVTTTMGDIRSRNQMIICGQGEGKKLRRALMWEGAKVNSDAIPFSMNH